MYKIDLQYHRCAAETLTAVSMSGTAFTKYSHYFIIYIKYKITRYMKFKIKVGTLLKT